MQPDLWGKHLWKSLHFIALGFPSQPSSEEVAAYREFFENLWKIIPCYKCSVNYKRHLNELPIQQALEGKESLFNWTVRLHNIVNKELGKPEVSIQEAWLLYTKDIEPSVHWNQKSWTATIIMIFIVIALLFIVYQLKKKT
jgi:hypothetical protein